MENKRWEAKFKKKKKTYIQKEPQSNPINLGTPLVLLKRSKLYEDKKTSLLISGQSTSNFKNLCKQKTSLLSYSLLK